MLHFIARDGSLSPPGGLAFGFDAISRATARASAHQVPRHGIFHRLSPFRSVTVSERFGQRQLGAMVIIHKWLSIVRRDLFKKKKNFLFI